MGAVYTALCLAASAAVFIIIIVLMGKSKGIYDEYIAPLDENEHKVKRFLPIGLYISQEVDLVSKLPKEIQSIIGRKRMEARSMIMEMNDTKYADYYYSIYTAEKSVLCMLVIAAACVFSCILCLQGDSSTGIGLLIAGTIFGFAFSFILDSNLKKKIEERHNMLRMEFPDFVNKLVLLINAGMTVNRAWEKIVNDNKKNTPLQQELRIALLKMKDGTPEAYAIEEFGRRCKIKEIMKFTSVLISNLKKGGAEIVPVLIQQSNECWEMRKNAAKELGAAAGVKMMLPMVMLLFAIIIVVGFPAVLAMKGV